MLAGLILFTIGIICIVFPTQSTSVMQKVINHIGDKQARRMNTPIAEGDIVIRPVFSIIIGFVILALAFFAYSQSSG